MSHLPNILFLVLLVIHGLIHFAGFFKAFKFRELSEITGELSKPAGFVWLSAGLIFLLTALLYLAGQSFWPWMALLSILISQVLIITIWNDAKFGTIANLIILLVALPAMGNELFNNKVAEEQRILLERASRSAGERILHDEDIQHLPEIVQTWLLNSGVVGKPEISFVRLKQSGIMNTDPDGRWMDFSAVQYFDINHPSFIWKVDVRMMLLITLTGRDKLKDGQGGMLIKLFSLFNVVNEKENEQINTGTLIRYLGEICWFPSAALKEYIKWEEIDEHSAKATLTAGTQQVSGIFRFGENGDLKSFEADRYYGGGPEATKHSWVVETIEYRSFDGYHVPGNSTVTWKLPEGDFTWLHLEITDLEVNRYELYP
jgi:membrane protein implicated in regulation of membrane protease activity